VHVYLNKLLIPIIFFGFLVQAQATPGNFVYQGQIIKPNGHALDTNNVQFTVEIISPGAEQCILFRERHNVNMVGSNGIFALEVGDGVPVSSSFTTASSLAAALNNSAGTLTGLECASVGEYTPSMNDHRQLRITFNDGSGPNTLTQDHRILSVPYAQSAATLNGLEGADLLVQREEAGFVLNQDNLESVFTDTNYPELMALLNGTSSTYLSSMPAADFSMNSNRITDLESPVDPNDATNKNYVDSTIGGLTADPSIATLSVAETGQVLTWNGTQWETSEIVMEDTTKLPLAGGTMTGAIDMGNQNITNANQISLNGDLNADGNATILGDALVSGGIGVATGINSDGDISIHDLQALQLGNDLYGSSNYVGFRAPTLIPVDVIWTLPGSDGNIGQVLSTNGLGELSWVDPVDIMGTPALGGLVDNADYIMIYDTSEGELRRATRAELVLTEAEVDAYVANNGYASDADLSALDGRVTTNEGNITSLDTRVGTAEGDITGLQADVAGVQTDVANLDTRVTAAEGEITTIDGRVTTNETDITNLTTRVTDAEGEITAIDGRVTTNETDISNLDTRVTANEGAVTALDGRMTTAEGNISTLQTQVGNLNTDLSAVQTDLATAQTDITNLTTRVTDNEGDISTLQGQMTTANTNISDLDGRVTVNEGAITALDTNKVNRAGDTMSGNLILADREVRFTSGGANFVGLRAPAGLSADQVWTLPGSDGSVGQVLETDGAGALRWRTLDAVGESNTASNIGTGGVGVFVDKDGVDLRFRNISAASNKVTVTANANNIDVDVDESNLDAGLIANTPAGDIEATDIQAAINELDTEKVAKSGDTMTGDLTLATNNALILGDSGANYVGFVAPATVSASQIWTLPIADGAANQVLQTNGLGVLSWVDQSEFTPTAGDYTASDITFDSSLLSVTSTDVQGAIGELDGRMVTAEGNITSIQGDVTTAQTDITNLGTRVTATEGDISTLQGQMTTANTNISDLDGRVTVNEGAITALDTNKVNRAGDTMSGNLTLADREVRFTSGGANFVGLRAPAGLSADQVWTLPGSDGSVGQVLETDGLGALRWRTLDSVGESNTASNIGAGGVGVFIDKDGVDLRFRNISAASNKVTVTANANNIDVDVDESNLDAGLIANTPAGDIEATDIQAAINELDTEKVAKSGDTMTGDLTLATNNALILGDSGANYVGFVAPATVSASQIWTLPIADGAANQVLQTNGLGVLSWVDQSEFTPTAGDYTASDITFDSSLLSVTSTDVQGAIGELDGRMVTAEANITSIQGDVTTAQTDITNLGTRITATEGDITTLQGQMTTANTNISDLDGRVTVNEGAITALDTNKVNRAGDTMSGNLTLADREVRFTSGGANFVGLRAPAGLSADQIWTLPTADGSSGQVLQTDGTGVLSWVTQTSGADNLGNHTATEDLNLANNNIINLNQGSAASPSLSFNTDGNTGLYSPGPDSLALSTAGNSALEIDPSGNIGIGSAPISDHKLSVTNTTQYLDFGLRSHGNGWYDAPFINLYRSRGSLGSEANVNNNDLLGGIESLPRSGGTYPNALTNMAASIRFYAEENMTTSSRRGARISFFTSPVGTNSNTERMTIKNDGRVGIGVTTPEERLHVAGSILSGPKSGSSGDAGAILLRELADNGENFVGFRAPDSLSSNIVWQLPAADGAANQVLQTNGLGVLSWVDQAEFTPTASDYAAIDITFDPSALSVTSTDVQGAIGELDGRMVTAEGNITSIQGDVTTAQTDITNLGTRVTATEGDITTLQGQITTANTNISDLDGRVTVNEGAITALDTNKVDRGGDTMTGNLTLADREVRFTSGGANFVGLRAPAGLSADQVWTLPSVDGGAGQVLQTNGTGALSWVDMASGSDNLGNHTATQNLDMADNNIINLNQGSAANPSLSFNGDLNTGIYSSGADLFGISTAGSQRFIVDGFGNSLFGSGTLTANSFFEVSGGTRSTAGQGGNILLRAQDAGVGSNVGGSVMLQTGFGVGGWGDGNISLNAHNGNLHFERGSSKIYSPGSDESAYFFTNGWAVDNNSSIMQLSTRNGSSNWHHGYFGVVNRPGAVHSPIFVWGGTTTSDSTFEERMRLDENARLGVGTSSPEERLDVAGSIVSGPKGTASGEAGSVIMRELVANGANYVGFRAPDSLGADMVWTLPSADGTNGQVLQTNGSGALSWIDPADAAPVTSVFGRTGVVAAQLNDYSADLITNTPNGDIAAANVQAAINELDDEKVSKSGDTMSGDLTLTNNNAIVLADAGANYVGFVAPATVTASQIWALPSADGTTGQVLQTNGLGALSWTDLSSASGDFMANGSVPMTGQLSGVNGSSGAPAFTFDGDANTGIFRPAADTLAFSTNGSERFRITQGGRFGINNNNPATDFHAISATNIFEWPWGDATVRAVGTNSSTGTGSFSAHAGNGSSLKTGFMTVTLDDMRIGTGSDNGGIPLHLRTNDQNRMTIRADGNVGIGTTVPDDKFVVSGSSASPIKSVVENLDDASYAESGVRVSTANGGSAVFGSTHADPNLRNNTQFGASHSIYISTNTNVQNGGSGSINFMTGGWDTTTQRRMTIAANGNVGVGTATPRARLDVNGAISAAPAVAESGGTINFASSNFAFSEANCGSFTLNNMVDGATYTLAIQGTAEATCSFTATNPNGGSLAVKLPPSHGATTASTETLYSFVVIGTSVYVAWVPGYTP
jgi:peptidoglycan hydrolase CwlO-like protein